MSEHKLSELVALSLVARWPLRDVARDWSKALEPPRWRWVKHRRWRKTEQPEHMERRLQQLMTADALSDRSFGFKGQR